MNVLTGKCSVEGIVQASAITLADDRMHRANLMGLKYQAEYEQALAALAEIRMQKCYEYGEKAYDPGLSPDFNRWMRFSDVARKVARLERQNERGDTTGLAETYADLSNYAIMGFQILRRK